MISESRCKHCKIYDFIDEKIEEDTIVQPDCSIVCKPISKKILDFPAALIVEILSPATALKDWHTKFSIYEKLGMKYYMIVDEENSQVEIYHLEKSEYVLQKSSSKTSFIFYLDDDCKVEVS